MPYLSTEQFYQPMNDSIRRARQAAQEQGMRDSEFNERARSLQLRQGESDLTEGRRRYDLGREDDRYRFDTRRQQFDGLMKMLFGAAPEQGGMNALRMQVGTGGSAYGPPDDGIDRRSINNSLARYIRGGM